MKPPHENFLRTPLKPPKQYTKLPKLKYEKYKLVKFCQFYNVKA